MYRILYLILYADSIVINIVSMVLLQSAYVFTCIRNNAEDMLLLSFTIKFDKADGWQ